MYWGPSELHFTYLCFYFWSRALLCPKNRLFWPKNDVFKQLRPKWRKLTFPEIHFYVYWGCLSIIWAHFELLMILCMVKCQTHPLCSGSVLIIALSESLKILSMTHSIPNICFNKKINCFWFCDNDVILDCQVNYPLIKYQPNIKRWQTSVD